jgi:hypothetical protein
VFGFHRGLQRMKELEARFGVKKQAINQVKF